MKHIPLLLAFLALAAVLAVGVPPFLRSPVWVDVTYHDVSAWNILHGGIHYRDVFETNLPGMVWVHAILRPLIGWSHEAIRVADLLVIGSVLALLTGFTCRAGVSRAGQVWFVVAGVVFYLFETEFIHCQRDGWMLLPAVAAGTMRLRRIDGQSAGWSLLEGFLWGLAVWIKPHVLVPALAVWLVSWRFQPGRAAGRDTLALLAGGLLAGGLGSAWLLATGTWGPMWDVLLHWNSEYYRWSWADLAMKVRLAITYFSPFSLVHLAAVPLGVVAVCRRDPVRAVLAAVYLGWLAQATLIQKPFDYAHAPPTLLGLAVLASFRWPVGPVFLGWCLLACLVNQWAWESLAGLRRHYPVTTRTVLPYHPLVRPDRLAVWGRCWHDDSWELKDHLSAFANIHSAPDWADLARVAQFLRSKDLHDRDLICWHDSTHPLYVWLGIRPGIRYPHVITAMKFRSRQEQIRAETFASPARYVVSDLVPVTYLNRFGPPPPPGPARDLPPEFPAWRRDVYPWNQPVVFRAGRYVVHEITAPRGEIMFPMPDELWE